MEPFLKFDLATIGKHMPRARHQNGWVELTGTKVKTWTDYYYVYENGKRLQRSKVLGPKARLTKGQAEDELRAHIRKIETGISSDRPNQTELAQVKKIPSFEAACERYLNLKSGDWGVKTKGAMRSIFKMQIVPRIRQRLVTDLKPSDIKELFNAIAEAGSYSLVRKAMTHVRGVFDVLVGDGVLQSNPAKAKIITKPKTRKPSERFLEIVECRRLLAVAQGRDYMILRLFLGCALRPAELFALRLEDLEPGRLRIDEAAVPAIGLKEVKTEESDGYVPLAADIETELRLYVKREAFSYPKELLFPSEVGTAMSHENYLDRVLKPLGVAANIDVVVSPDGTKTSKLNHQILRRTGRYPHAEARAGKVSAGTIAACAPEYHAWVLPEGA